MPEPRKSSRRPKHAGRTAAVEGKVRQEFWLRHSAALAEAQEFLGTATERRDRRSRVGTSCVRRDLAAGARALERHGLQRRLIRRPWPSASFGNTSSIPIASSTLLGTPMHERRLRRLRSSRPPTSARWSKPNSALELAESRHIGAPCSGLPVAEIGSSRPPCARGRCSAPRWQPSATAKGSCSAKFGAASSSTFSSHTLRRLELHSCPRIPRISTGSAEYFRLTSWRHLQASMTELSNER